MTRLVVFLMVFEIFNNESVNSTFKYKLGGFNTWELVLDITDYKLEFVLNSSTFTHRINYQMKGRDVCYGNEK